MASITSQFQNTKLLVERYRNSTVVLSGLNLSPTSLPQRIRHSMAEVLASPTNATNILTDASEREQFVNFATMWVGSHKRFIQ